MGITDKICQLSVDYRALSFVLATLTIGLFKISRCDPAFLHKLYCRDRVYAKGKVPARAEVGLSLLCSESINFRLLC